MQKIKLTKDEVLNNYFLINLSAVPFYELVCKKATGLKMNEISAIDPSKIYCSKGVFELSEDSFLKNHPDFHRESFAMRWVDCGPKVDESLPDYTIVLEEGAIERSK